MSNTDTPLLKVEDLHVKYRRRDQPDVHAVRGVSFEIEQGETIGIVGESGCGKSTLAKALLRGLPSNGEITDGKIIFDGKDLTTIPMKEMKKHRWKDISMIAQGAMASLNPVYSIGNQINEAIQAHEKGVSKTEGYERAREMLELVGIDPNRVHDYPHQLSGGMRQRVVIAMSLILEPRLVIADEPTTALDVIVQKQILSKVRTVQERLQSSMLIITHDISVVAETCDKMIVMYGGEIMESGSITDVFNRAHHPYTLGLQNAFPSIEGEPRELVSIPGTPPDLAESRNGCPFIQRCPYSEDICDTPLPIKEISTEHQVRCHEPTPFDEIRRTGNEKETWRSQKTANAAEVNDD